MAAQASAPAIFAWLLITCVSPARRVSVLYRGPRPAPAPPGLPHPRGSRTPGAPARDQFYIPILSCTFKATNPPCTRRTHPPSLIRAAGSAAHTPRPNRVLACAPAQVTWCPRTSPRLHSLS
eukprot:scaffold2635_cov106-Isochrysis_galbana.AAC.8